MTTYDITTHETVSEIRRYLVRAPSEADAVQRVLSGMEEDFDLEAAGVEKREIVAAMPLEEHGPYPPVEAGDGPCVTHFIGARTEWTPSHGFKPTNRFMIYGTVFLSRDGHPKEMLPRLRRFLTSTQASITHKDSPQPTILAAEWVTFLVNHFRTKPGPNNPDVSVVNHDSGGADYRWFIDCTAWPDDHPDRTTRPRVGLQYAEIDLERLKMEPTPWRFDQITWIALDADT